MGFQRPDYSAPETTIKAFQMNLAHVLSVGQALNELNPLSRAYVQLSRSSKGHHLKLQWTPMNNTIAAIIERSTDARPTERQVFAKTPAGSERHY